MSSENSVNNKYKNLKLILENENLEKLYGKSEEDIQNFLNGTLENKKASVSGIETGKISDVDGLREILKKLVIETDNNLEEKNMSVRKIFEQIRNGILPYGMTIGEDFIERIPDTGLNQKEKILLLMIYALHNTISNNKEYFYNIDMIQELYVYNS